MRQRLTRVVFLVYPRAWRDRYGDEVRDLTDELASTEHASWWRLVIGLFSSGLAARARSWRPRKWIAYLSACVVLAVVVVSLSTTASRSPQISPRVTSVHTVHPTFVLLNPETGNVVPSTNVGFPQVKCTVTLNPETGAALSFQPAGDDPTGCSAYMNSPEHSNDNRNG
jgi:hypothetical protein